MALFVIVCGALLMAGGATSLLAGFDIVMTERGAAMTLGGVVALSGGLVAVGIGFALLRLSQILRALETRAGKAAKSAVQERPVVPVVASDHVEPVLTKPGEDNDTLPGPKMTAAVGAGIVAAAGIAAGVGLGRHTHTADADAQIEPQGIDSPAVPAAADIPAQDVAAVPPDLEAELARALAEPEAGEPSLAAAKDESFGNGLSAFLARSVGRKRKSEEIAPALPRAEELPVSQNEGAAQEEALASLSETLESSDSIEIQVLPIGSAQDVEVEQDEVLAAAADQSEGTHDDIPPENPENGDVKDVPDGNEDNGVVADPDAPEPEVLSDVPDIAIDEASAGAVPFTGGAPEDFTQAPPRKPEVLGTYNTGGRTYSMYADGTVEAVTESGVERFTSMEELRKHLSKV